MNAIELMRSWPGLSAATPAELLASPAWRLSTEFEGGAATLTVRGAAVPAADDELLLSVTLDDVPHVLGLSRAEIFPDLAILWDRRAVLPEQLLVALVEKECSSALQTLENLFRQELRLKGVAAVTGPAVRTSFSLEGQAGSFAFSLDLPEEVVGRFGVLDNLDPAHPAIADLTRTTYGISRTFEGLDASSLAEGAYLLLDDASAKPNPHWETELPDDGAVRVIVAAPRTFRFVDFANDALPAVPEIGTEPLAVAVGAALRFSATPARVGERPALQLKGL